jgi:hypothetical protein
MKFNGSILVIGDLGQLKAYRVVEVSGTDRLESTQVSHIQNRGTQKESTVLELVTNIDYLESHGKSAEHVSDQAGRFGESMGASMGEAHEMGEAHNTALERERRTLKAISEDIKAIIEKESPRSWYLAFPKDKHNKLGEMLSADIKKTLKKSVPSDLTKMKTGELLSHFE